MAKKKFGNILVFLIFATLTASINSYCPNSQICNCTSEFIKCICNQREALTFDEEEDNFTGKEITIKGCGRIDLMKFSLNNLDVESVHISDLLEMYIEPNAFDSSTIRNFHIYNISEFHLESYGLGNIKNIYSLIINNVTFENILPAILGDTGAQNVAVTNSYIGTIKSRAFHMQSIESFVMENNVINAFDSTSIAIKDVINFKFNRNLVMSTNFGCISLTAANEVDIGHCSFKQTHSSMIVIKDVNVFLFHDNTIDNCEERTFWSIHANKRVSFVNNQILMAGEDCFFPNLGPNQVDLSIIVYDNNSFVCNCELDWILIFKTPSYDFMKEKSVCNNPYHLIGLKLSEVTASMDHFGTCLSIEALSTTTTMSSTVPVMTERKLPSQISTTSLRIKEPYVSSLSSSVQITTAVPLKANVQNEYAPQSSSENMYLHSSLLLTSLFSLTIWWLQISAHPI